MSSALVSGKEWSASISKMLFTKTIGLRKNISDRRPAFVENMTFFFLILCPLKLWTISPDHLQKGRDEVGAETKGFTFEQIKAKKRMKR